MASDAVGGVSSSVPPASIERGHPAAAPAPGSVEAFASVLDRHLAAPRADISAIRAEIDSVRSGSPFFARALDAGGRAAEATSTIGALTDVSSRLEAQLAAQSTGDAADPYGWRATSRQIADQVIGPGYGALFERQMQQESGFLPDVVYGLRVSSAGAEGIAQLMPQYYPHVDRTDPIAGLQAGAETMRHYLDVWNGDVRRALASYNAGLGRVQSLVAAHGAQWEAGLPLETRSYLTAILGTASPRYTGSAVRENAVDGGAVFGGRGPGGVLTAPMAGATMRPDGLAVDYLGVEGTPVRSPSDGVVVEAGNGRVTIDHGNGWRSVLEGAVPSVAPGVALRRSEVVGALGAGETLRLSVTSGGQAVDASRYLLGGT